MPPRRASGSSSSATIGRSAYLVSVEDGQRLSATADEIRRRRLAALDRLLAFAEEMRIKHPPQPGDPDAETAVRLDRDRDEPKDETMTDLRPIVVDSSVAIALVRDEAVASSIRQMIRFWAEINQPLVVPSLFWYELINPLARQYRYTSQQVLQAVDEVEELTLITVEPGSTAVPADDRSRRALRTDGLRRALPRAVHAARVPHRDP